MIDEPRATTKRAAGRKPRRRHRALAVLGTLLACLVPIAAALAVVGLEAARADRNATRQALPTGPSRTRLNEPTTLPVPASPTALGRPVDPDTGIPNPDVVEGRRVDYLFAGGTDFTAPHIPVRTFGVLGHWRTLADALPKVPAWAGSWVWNPNVRHVGDHWVMWFTAPTLANELTTGAHPRCLGWATARSVLGPYRPSSNPAVCQLSLYGAIDPSTFVAPDGQEWLYWKNDGNAVPDDQLSTTIWVARLAGNGTTLEGQPVALMSNTQPWQGTVVEAPQMLEADGRYWLFYSGNVSGSPANGIGVASCAGPGGPCANTSTGPWLERTTAVPSAGEESFFTQSKRTWMLYSTSGGYYQNLMVSRVAFGSLGPYVAHFTQLPTVDPPRR